MITNFRKFQQDVEYLQKNYVDKIELPVFSTLENNFVDGVNAFEGYQRGWGLQYSKESPHFADVVEQVRNDALYQFALSAASELTVVSEARRMNIFLILLKFIHKIDPGDIVEFGSYKGGNAIFLAIVLKVLGLDRKVYACDSFEGMPPTDKAIDLHNEGDFSDVDFSELKRYKSDLELDNLVLVKGYFSNSLATKQMDNLSFSLAHIDCDIYDACADSFQYLKTRMVNKGYLVFDDATVSSCIGATRFVEKEVVRKANLNSEQIWPHFVFRWMRE